MFFLKFSCFFYDPMDVDNLISGSFVFSKSSSYIWKLIPYLSYYLQALFPIQYVVDLSMGSFAIQKLLCLIGSHLFIFAFNSFSLLFDYAKAFDHVDHNKLWKILKEMGIPDHLTWLLRNLHAG